MEWGGLSTSGSMLGKNLNAEGACTNGALCTLLDAAASSLGSVLFSVPCFCFCYSPPVWLRVRVR